MHRLMAAAGTNPHTGAPYNTDASMLMRRRRVHFFTVPLEKPQSQTPYCARCFAQMVVSSGVMAPLAMPM